VFKTACLDMQRLIAAGLAPQLMAVNVSVAQFKSPTFVARIEQTLLDTGLAAGRIELEITESVAALGLGVVEPILERLRRLGLSVAIDDFGTGYSSLAYLDRLPLDRIKIDREFVRQLQDGHEARIAALIAQLGSTLGLRVLAEGIEDAQVWRKLQNIGCHEGQGFHIARPMPFADLPAWLRQWNR
jgi:EAL domain-containing protein (putative c-di-GMP-specific phosphodiesterase class I)